MKQKTVNSDIRIDGVNVYNGRKNYAIFHPAKENSGINFYLNGEKIKGNLENAFHKRKAIFLTNSKKEVGLVEHLLSSVYVLGIDNVDIELSDGISPTVDNCAQEYFLKLKDSLVDQDAKKSFWKYSLKIPSVVDFSGIPDRIMVLPSDGFNLSYYFYYPHHSLGEQAFSFNGDPEIFEREVCDSRPPGFLGKFSGVLSVLGKMGLHGLNNKNYIFVGNKNEEEIRNPPPFGLKHNGQEPVRHKVLDVLGTSALTGKQFKDTSLDFYMTGHRSDLFALNKFFSDGVFEEVE